MLGLPPIDGTVPDLGAVFQAAVLPSCLWAIALGIWLRIIDKSF